MTAASTTRRRTAAGTIVLLPDARQRPKRTRRAPGAGPGTLTHWSAGYDAAIVAVWRQHCAGAIDWDTAGARHHELIRLRDGREVRA
jgi:hypothetical protein